MEQVVKSEMQSNEEILLFYVDEDGGNEEGVLTTIENIQQNIEHDTAYVLEDAEESVDENELSQAAVQACSRERWSDEEIKRLLIFYIDNKNAFISGSTKRKHLWTVACKTMLRGKKSNSCEIKLRYLRNKYAQLRAEQKNLLEIHWPFFGLCHQAFHDDNNIDTQISENNVEEKPQLMMPIKTKTNEDGIVVVKKMNNVRPGDEKIETMLNLYWKLKKQHKKEHWQREIWETIASELGAEDAEYWHKRFLNYKQHYIRLLDKRQESGSESVSWPYMSLFDQIFENDEDFKRKFANSASTNVTANNTAELVNIVTVYDWDDTEKTVLVKYYFDCFDEFQDSTIPNNFLWNEIGRLLDRSPESCKKKYEDMKNAHLDKYIQNSYTISNRIPLCILYDSVISKEVLVELNRESRQSEQWETFKMQEIDDLVQFLYDNVEMFKDSICYFVCWAAISKKMQKSIQNCKKQWDDLIALYKNILEDKKENPDMQIDWRYIELFDRIFDYGMDIKLLEGYEKFQELNQRKDSEKIGVKKLKVKLQDDKYAENGNEDEEYFDERGFTKHSKRGEGDSKVFKILEFYQKNKDKFTTQRRKQALWDSLAKQIGMSAEQCAHRFRNLKQVYTAYVQREVSRPEMPIIWPYYALCKKVFGYRALKSKLKNGKMDSDDEEEWSAKEIKQLINFFGKNFNEINNDIENKSKWLPLTNDIDKTETACYEKFLELRKSYRKLKTMRTRNPEVKVNWKYFNMFDEIYNSAERTMRDDKSAMIEEAMEIDQYQVVSADNIKSESQDDDEYQCIIILPDGQELSYINNGETITGDNVEIITQESLQNVAQGNEEIIAQHSVVQDSDVIMQENPKISPAEISMTPNVENAIMQENLDIIMSTANSTVVPKWTKRTKKKLLVFYINYIRTHKGQEINPREMWKEIASKLDKTPLSCRKMFMKLKNHHKQSVNIEDANKKKTPYYTLLDKIFALKPKFVKNIKNKELQESNTFTDVPLPILKVLQALEYYIQHIEEFLNPRYEKKYVWAELADFVSEPLTKVYNKVNYLKQNYNVETDQVAGEKTPFGDHLKEIIAKENQFKNEMDNNQKPVNVEEKLEYTWTDDEIIELLEFYLTRLDQFKSPKYIRSYLWSDAANILKKSPLACSKKMTEIRTQYRNMVRESPDKLNDWKFYSFCQKIYGTGKKNTVEDNK